MELFVAFEVEYTNEFKEWWNQSLDENEQDEITAVVGLLEQKGPQLHFP